MIPRLAEFLDRLEPALTIGPDEGLGDAARILRDAPGRRGVFVEEDGEITGVVTLDELLGVAAWATGRAEISWGRMLHYRNARTVRDLAREAHALDADATLNDAVNLLKECDEDEVLIYHEGELRGVLSEPRLLGFLLEGTHAFEAPELRGAARR